MEEHIYKKVEITGSSTESCDDAIRNAISKAGKSLRSLRWFEVEEIRGDIDGNEVRHWQVTLKVGFRLEE